MIADFLQQLSPAYTGEELFDRLFDVVYFLKDGRGAYLVVNDTLVERLGVGGKSALIGRTPAEVLPSPLGDRYAAQDRQVLQTGVPLLTQLELHLYPTGEMGWCLTTKLPLRNIRGRVVGLVGVSQDLRMPEIDSAEYRQLATAIEYAEQHLDQPPSVLQLAELAGMSRYQLDRRMQRVFGLSAGQWLIKCRIQAAQRQLESTSASVAIVAASAGYSDQSAFTRQFRKATGLTPNEYRTARSLKPPPTS